MSTNTKAHPLALPDDYDEDDLDNIIDINMSKHKTVDNSHCNNKNSNLFQTKASESSSTQNVPLLPSNKIPTAYKKRIAPAPPPSSPYQHQQQQYQQQQQQATLTSSASFVSTTNLSKRDEQKNTSSTNSLTSNNGGADCYFFIDIHHVRWFYKGEKTDKENNNTNSNNNTSNVSTLNTDEMTASFSSTTSNDSSTTTNNLAGNSDVNVHKISSKKWLMFNKIDSYNLELEYRDMISKKLQNITVDPPKTVQVLDSLYEVNITTKKCYSIYWKSRMISVMRAIWFMDNGEPFENVKSAEEIEKKHIDLFRGDLLKSFDSDGSLNADTDSVKIGSEASSTSPTEEVGGTSGKSKTAEIKIERKHSFVFNI